MYSMSYSLCIRVTHQGVAPLLSGLPPASRRRQTPLLGLPPLWASPPGGMGAGGVPPVPRGTGPSWSDRTRTLTPRGFDGRGFGPQAPLERSLHAVV